MKFLIESVAGRTAGDYDPKADRRRVYEMALKEIMNLSKVGSMLAKKGHNQFTLKILNEESCFFIPFERKLVSRKDFRKEAKDLAERQEVTFTHDNQFCCLTAASTAEQLWLLQSKPVNPFYLL